MLIGLQNYPGTGMAPDSPRSVFIMFESGDFKKHVVLVSRDDK